MIQIFSSSLKIIGAFLLTSSTVYAACFQFTAGSPQQIGNIQFASPPRYVCLQAVNGFAGQAYTSLRFVDGQGDLAQFAVREIARGRCPGLCSQLELLSGNNNGFNVNPVGIRVELTETHMVIKPGRGFTQTFSIIRNQRK